MFVDFPGCTSGIVVLRGAFGDFERCAWDHHIASVGGAAPPGGVGYDQRLFQTAIEFGSMRTSGNRYSGRGLLLPALLREGQCAAIVVFHGWMLTGVFVFDLTTHAAAFRHAC